MKLLRRIHLYLGVFFAPLLLFYVCTGWYQTVSVQRNKTSQELGDWKARLTSVHVDQIYPSEKAESYSPKLFQWLVVVMAAALVLTVGIGVYLAFQVSRRRWPVWLALVSGVGVPILMLWLGQKR